VFFGFTVHAENKIDHLSRDPAARVKVEGFQWGWRFSYLRPNGTVIGTPVVGTQNQNPVLVLPEGETVQLELVSDDVIHSFFVPAFLFKRDLIPGVDNKIDRFINRDGVFPGHCAAFCGLYHATMNFTVQAVTRQQYASMFPGGTT
jgi:cytochrome c oxidase subunit 2